MRPSDHASPGATAVRCGEYHLRVRVSAEFREMPGLKITLVQAARLFNLDLAQCERVLAALVEVGVLSTDGRTFARADLGRRCA